MFNQVVKGLLFVLVLSVAIAGCDGFTEIPPESQRTVEEFFETRSDFNTALNGAYNSFQDLGTFNRNYWVLFEMRSDNTDQGPDVTGLARDLFVVNEFAENTTNEFVEETWIDSYEGIQRANLILASLEDVGDSLEDDFKSRIRGEALFIRSVLYFHLAVAFGNIPFRLEPTETVELGSDVDDEQVSASAVYDQLTTDLQEAQANLPETVSSEEVGRATSGAANAFLGKIALQNGDNDTAEQALRRVVDSGQFRLLDDYSDLWGPENENNDESIFEVQFVAGGQGLGSRFTNTFSPSSDLQEGEGLAENRPTVNMLNAYPEGDERFDPSIDTTFVDADGEVQDARHTIKYESEPFSNFDAENNWVFLRYADVLLMLAEAIGPSGEAWGLIDQVRNRAGLDNVERTDFFETLLEERRVELAFENHRWIDLRRFARNHDISIEDRLAREVDDISTFTELYPIPQSQIDVAGLEQNPEHQQ